jgi:hypothetical protein
MQFDYKEWTVVLLNNKAIYWCKGNPEEKHTLYNTGGNQSLVKAFLDEIGLRLEEERELVAQVLKAIHAAILSSSFTQEEKASLGAEQSRLEALIEKNG